MDNKQILQLFKTASSLLELHQANPFQIRAYQNFLMSMEGFAQPILESSTTTLTTLGATKGFLAKIEEIKETGTFNDLTELLEVTPKGVRDMLKIKGIGAKKINKIWKELSIESLDDLLVACENDEIAELKGFAKKTQDNIAQQIRFLKEQEGKMLYAEVEALAYDLENQCKNLGLKISIVGEFIRRMEIIETLQYIIASNDPLFVFEKINSIQGIIETPSLSGVFVWRGKLENSDFSIEFKIVSEEKFINQTFIYSANEEHLEYTLPTQETLLSHALKTTADSHEEIYKQANLPFYIPEIREGEFEFEYTIDNPPPQFLEVNDLKGSLHNHSTYSDGQNSLREMAEYCQELGYQYLGISDHSKTAYYANGLPEEGIEAQHQEIDLLNAEFNNFKIFKGIESDILADGSLDYVDEVLASFDFIVASIHSGLSMTEKKATDRLIKAIENPYTTMLGHPTGRLLLRREAYPLNHKKVIDACAQNNVCIEINANPWRLDLDWRWVHYALEKNVMLSINPDAHVKEGFLDMHYGTLVGRKGGLTKEMTLNSFSLEEISAYFDKKRP